MDWGFGGFGKSREHVVGGVNLWKNVSNLLNKRTIEIRLATSFNLWFERRVSDHNRDYLPNPGRSTMICWSDLIWLPLYGQPLSVEPVDRRWLAKSMLCALLERTPHAPDRDAHPNIRRPLFFRNLNLCMLPLSQPQPQPTDQRIRWLAGLRIPRPCLKMSALWSSGIHCISCKIDILVNQSKIPIYPCRIWDYLVPAEWDFRTCGCVTGSELLISCDMSSRGNRHTKGFPNWPGV